MKCNNNSLIAAVTGQMLVKQGECCEDPSAFCILYQGNHATYPFPACLYHITKLHITACKLLVVAQGFASGARAAVWHYGADEPW